MLFSCAYAAEVWALIKSSSGFSFGPNSIANIWKQSLNLSKVDSWWLISLASSTLWFLWFARCKRIFMKEYISPVESFFKIIKFSSEQIHLTKWEDSLFFKDRSSLTPFFKSTDGSFWSEQYLAGIGWTIMQNEELKSAGMTPVRAYSPLQTEMLAIKAGIEDAFSKDYSNVVIITDSLNAYLAISNMVLPPDEISDLTKACQDKLQGINGRIQWTSRDQLSAPDTLAKSARTNAVCNYWTNSFPSWLLNLTCNDPLMFQ